MFSSSLDHATSSVRSIWDLQDVVMRNYPAAHHDPEDDAFCDKGDRRTRIAMSACIITTAAYLNNRDRLGILRPFYQRPISVQAPSE
jgi:hypothetical protein